MHFQRFYIEGHSNELQQLYGELTELLNGKEIFHLNEWTERYSLKEPKSNNLMIPT